MSTKNPLLLIDGLNMYIRAFCAYPTMNVNGESVGGIIGSLKTVQRLLFELQPSSVYVIWESGGSIKRRSVYKEYKLNRRPVQLNRFYEDDLQENVDQNQVKQMIILLKLLRCSPICQVYVPDCEADDVIAYLCCGKFKDKEKIIASSDKDFYQLLDDKTRSYSFHKKDYVTTSNVLETFRVTSKNFALAKALCGDPSDNIPGVKGLGFKTVARCFPVLGTEEDVLLDDVFNYCHTHLDESVVYRRVLDAEQDVRRNWKLVHLSTSSLSANQVSKVDTAVNTCVLRADKMAMIRCLISEGISDFDVDAYFYAFSGIRRS